MAFGDYVQFQRENRSRTFSRQILAADDTTALAGILVPRANHTLYIQRLVFYETTESNGKNLTFQDTATTPVVLGKYFSVTAAAGILKLLVLEYGPTGYALTAGKNLDVVVSAAGIAGALHVECYERLSSTINLTTANTSN